MRLSNLSSRRAVLLLALLVLALALALAPLASRAQAPAPVDPVALLEAARKDMEAVRTAQERTLDDTAIIELRKHALSAQTRADEAAALMAPQLADVRARIAELGEAAAGVKESPDVAAQRAQLMRSVSTFDSQIKLARLLAVEAEQATASASANRRQQFSARLEERIAPPVGATFWKDLGSVVPRDLQRLERLAGDLQTAVAAVSVGLWLALLGTVCLILLMHLALRRAVRHLCSTRVPAGRLRRSLHAAGSLAVRTLTPGLMAHALVLALTSSRSVSPLATRWLEGMEALVWFGAFVLGLGAVLLMSRKPSWRLPPVPDATAARLGWFPSMLVGAIALSWVSTRSASAVDASAASMWALNALGSLTFLAVFAAVLRQLGHHPATPHETHAGGVPLWWPTLRSGLWIVLFACAVAVLTGHVALGTFLANQLVWGCVVLGSAYLLAVLLDDLFMSLLATTEPPVEGAAAVPPHSRQRAAVLLSGLCRVLVGLFALVLLMAPYGEGPLDLLHRAGRLSEGLSIGELNVRPFAVLQAAAVLVLGLLAVRLLKGWLAKRFMPTTRMDAGMRLSVTTLAGYVGVVAVVAMAMSAMGVGLERVAWVASALSVGIGFGLQAVVQNFVSGLILLAERPVKVGDWVSLSGVEGDIRRINVRATEIQMGDRSTVIVPNSEFITKIVRNVTYGESLGMVQFKLPMPLATDTAKARAVLLEAFQAHPSVLPTPAPSVQLDGIDGTNLVLNASGFVNSPRSAYGVKSDLLFDALQRLRAAGLLPGGVPAA